jgi:anti-sigma-K factor RskA
MALCRAGSVASRSVFDLDEEEDAETVRRPWYKRFAFWRAAVPATFSILALAAALTLLLVPQFHFTTTVRVLLTCKWSLNDFAAEPTAFSHDCMLQRVSNRNCQARGPDASGECRCMWRQQTLRQHTATGQWKCTSS